MNARRIAFLLRQLAQIGTELAEELERDAPANDAPPPRRKRQPAAPVRPTRPPSELDMERAKKALRGLGYRVRP